MTALPRTPDFDHYPCAESIVSVEVSSATVIEVCWSDGRVDRHHPWTLRENSTDPATTAPLTRERVADIALWADDVAPRTVIVDGGRLVIAWAPDDVVAEYDTGWLRHLGGDEWRPQSVRPPIEPWDASFGPPPLFDGPAYLTDDAVLETALVALGRHGVIRLEQLPTDAETVLDVAHRIGLTRPTQFGPHFDVRTKHDADSQAYTGDRLSPHTDLPTRETPVGLQLLHCLANGVAGGESLMVDGFAVAERLRADEPDVFDTLCSARWVWGNRSQETDVRVSAPVVELRDGQLFEVRMANQLRLFPAMPFDRVDDSYRALRRFAQLCDNSEFAVTFPFRPGDCVIFDNRRILHGREAFDSGGGERHLRGCYVDRDDLYSRLRMLARARRAAAAN